MQFAANLGPYQRAYLCSLIWAFSVLRHNYTTVFTDSVSGQRRPRTVCAYRALRITLMFMKRFSKMAIASFVSYSVFFAFKRTFSSQNLSIFTLYSAFLNSFSFSK